MIRSTQFLLTVEQGKALISLALSKSSMIRTAAEEHTLVIVSGTTNAYLAKYILDDMGIGDRFDPTGFRRGANVPNGVKAPTGPFGNRDVVIQKGKWLEDATVFDIADALEKNDVIVKGANALQPDRKAAGIQIGHPKFGTIGPVLQAVMGKRVRLVIPVGLEKRVDSSIIELAAAVNKPESEGTRLQPVVGDIVTEIEAIGMLTGMTAVLIAAGGICGGEGSCTFLVNGESEQIEQLRETIRSLDLLKRS